MMKEILIFIFAPMLIGTAIGYLVAGDVGAGVGFIIGLGIANLSASGGGV